VRCKGDCAVRDVGEARATPARHVDDHSEARVNAPVDPGRDPPSVGPAVVVVERCQRTRDAPRRAAVARARRAWDSRCPSQSSR
jgi:hypothetical protein